MKHILLVVASLTLLIGCQSEESARLEVEQVIRAYFAGISAYDEDAIRSVCTDDYVLIEHGALWNNDSLINLLDTFKDKATITYRFEDFKTNIRGTMAFTHYWNHGLMEMEGQQTHFKWAESAAFRKENGKWKMALLHSTRLEPKEI